MDDSLGAPAPLRLGRYRVLVRVASGGMGTVWAAGLEGTAGVEKLVAIKTIRSDFAQQEPFRSMFLDEVRILSRIEHPHVAQVLDSGEHEGRPYVVLEWIDGASVAALDRSLRAGGASVSLPVALRIVADACSGLHAAHELRDEAGSLLQVVHRDVSPQNVLVCADGGVKLIDFGLAKARDRLAAETSASSLKGKVSYMSPEQALGGTVDRRADVFALGALAYELLAGRSPYAASNETATLHRLATGDPPPTPLPGTVPPAIAAIVFRAIDREPSNRFASAAEMRAAIEEATTCEPSLVATRTALAEYVRLNLADVLAGQRDLVARAMPSKAVSVAAHGVGRRWGVLTAAAAVVIAASALAWRTSWLPRASEAAAVPVAPVLAVPAPIPSAPSPGTAAPGSSNAPVNAQSFPAPARLPPTHAAKPKASTSGSGYASHHPDYGGF